jgi:hypothetical protein
MFKVGAKSESVDADSRAGSRHLRRALYMPALAAVHWDPHLKAFYEVLLARHKRKLQALMTDASSRSLIPFVLFAIAPGSQVRIDGWTGYTGLAKEGYPHHAVSISSSGDPAHVVMPGVQKIASLLKRWLLGTHQGSVTATHLDAYLDEFAFRFNRRKSRRRGMLFYRLLENAVVTQPVRYRPSRAGQTPEEQNR